MSRLWLFVGLVLLASSQVSWAKPARSGAESAIEERDRATQVVVLLLQSEVEVDTAGGTMLVSPDPITMVMGMLLDLSVQSTATKRRVEAVAPIRDSLIDFGFEQRIVDAIRTHLPTAWVEPSAPVNVARNEGDMRAILERSVPGNVLVVGVRYAFEQNIESAYVHANASLLRYERLPPTREEAKSMKRAQRKAAQPKPLITAAVQSDHAFYSPFDKKQPRGVLAYRGHAAAWALDDAAATRSALELGIVEVAELLKLKSDGLLVPKKDAKKEKIWAGSVNGPGVLRKAQVLDSRDERLIVDSDSTIHRVDPKQVKR